MSILFKEFEFLSEFEKRSLAADIDIERKKTSADCWLSLVLRVSLSGRQNLQKIQLCQWISRAISLTERLVVKLNRLQQNFITVCVKSFTFWSVATGT